MSRRRKVYFSQRRIKTEKEEEKIFGDGKYFLGDEVEKRRRKRRETFKERKYIICGGEEKRSRKRRKIFGE